MWGVFLLSIVIALNLFAAVALTQVYDPALVFLSIPNYMIIHTWMTKFKDIRISQIVGTSAWVLSMIIQTNYYGFLAVLLGLVLSCTASFVDTIMRNFWNTDPNLKPSSYLSQISEISAFLLIYTAQVFSQNSIPPIGTQPSTILEMLVLYSIFSVTLYMMKFEQKNDMTRQLLGGLAIIGIRLWHDDDFASPLLMFVLSAAGQKYVQPQKVLEDIPQPTLKRKQSSYQDEVSLFQHIMKHSDSRRIAVFLTLNLIFLFVEVLYGYWCNSLGLISDSAHMFFDCSALFIGLYASYMAKCDADKFYTYGYGRFEVLSGFVNGLFLVFVAFTVLSESIERILEPPTVSSDNLLLISVLGCLVNLFGLFSFHGDMEGQNMHGVFLHVLADTLGSVGVIVSAFLIENYGLYISDPICSLLISGLILAASFPLLSESATILAQHSMKPPKFFKGAK